VPGGGLTVSSTAERVAVVLFGLNLTLAALMLYLMLRHAGRTPEVAADDLAGAELRAFATQRLSAVLLQASATVVGVFLPLLAVVFYLALAVFYVIDPIRRMRTHAPPSQDKRQNRGRLTRSRGRGAGV
jgi:hypothetical protein